MDKERLEEIKEHFSYCIDEGLTIGEGEEKLLYELYEKVKEKKWHKKDYEEMCRLQDENARLCEALEFYRKPDIGR